MAAARLATAAGASQKGGVQPAGPGRLGAERSGHLRWCALACCPGAACCAMHCTVASGTWRCHALCQACQTLPQYMCILLVLLLAYLLLSRPKRIWGMHNTFRHVMAKHRISMQHVFRIPLFCYGLVCQRRHCWTSCQAAQVVPHAWCPSYILAHTSMRTPRIHAG